MIVIEQVDLLPLCGSCYCGHIKYEITEEVLKKGVCHSHSCQKLTGGACWPFLRFWRRRRPTHYVY